MKTVKTIQLKDHIKSSRLGMKLLSITMPSLLSAMLLTTVPAGATNGFTEIVHVDFDNDTPSQRPLTGGPNQPTSLFGNSILVQSYANGITTQPVVIEALAAGYYQSVDTLFNPVSEGVVLIETTVAFNRLADGSFLQTIAATGPYPSAVVTRLITTDLGEIKDDITRTTAGIYAPNQPIRVRMTIDMSAKTWAVAIDNEMNGFDDDPMISNLPFENRVDVLPTVGGVLASLNLFPTLSVAPTAIAYDDISVLVPMATIAVDIDIKPGSSRNSINPRSEGVIPVAILNTAVFDPTTVNLTTVHFGATGTEAAPSKYHLEDIDGDGDVDLILHFRTQATGIQYGDADAFLTGETFNGQMILGADAVSIVGR